MIQAKFITGRQLATDTKAKQRKSANRRLGDEADVRENALLSAVAAGDRAAFDELYRLYYPRLSDFLARMLSAGGYTDEVINDTMYVIWTKADTFAGRSRVSTWIFGIAYKKSDKTTGTGGTSALRTITRGLGNSRSKPDGAENAVSELQLKQNLI